MSWANPTRISGIFSVVCLAILALMAGQPYFTNASEPPRGISNPIIALETVRSVAEVDDVLRDAPSSDREVMRIKLYLDFALIAALAALFLRLGWESVRAGGILRATGIAAMACALGMAAAEAIRNIAMLGLLDVSLAGTSPPLLSAIRDPAAAGWALTGFTLALLSGRYFRGTTLQKVIASLALLTAAMQLYGLRENVFLVWQLYPAVLALVLMLAPLMVRTVPAHFKEPRA